MTSRQLKTFVRPRHAPIGTGSSQSSLSGKRKFIPGGFNDSIKNAALAVRTIHKGGVSASDVNIYGILINVGPPKTVTAKEDKKPKNGNKKKWSLTTAMYTVIIGNLDDVVVTPPVSDRDENGNIIIRGSWSSKSIEELDSIGQSDRLPHINNAATIKPYSTICIRCEVNNNVHPGDVIRLLNVNMSVIFNGPGVMYEERGFLSAKNIIPVCKITPQQFITACDYARAFTTYIPEPDPSTMAPGYRKPYTNDPETELYCFLTGPSSTFEDEYGNFFSLSVVDDPRGFTASKFAPPGWRYKGVPKDQKPTMDQMDQDLCLKIAVGGAQRAYMGGDQYSDSTFLLKIAGYNDGYITLKMTGESYFKESPLFVFAITEPLVWKALMSAYYRLMNVVLFTNVNKKDTPKLAGELSSVGSGGGASSYDNHDGGSGEGSSTAAVYEDPLGLHEKDSYEGDGGDEDDMYAVSVPSNDDGAGDKSGGSGEEEVVDASKININFVYAMYLSYVHFDAKTFWKSYGLKISPELANFIVKNTRCQGSKLVPDPDYGTKSTGALKSEKKDRNLKKHSKILQNIGCCNVATSMERYKYVLSKYGDFCVVIPWANVDETYPEMIASMDVDMQTSLFLNTYILKKKFVTEERKKANKKAYDFFEKILTPKYTPESPEWKKSAAAKIFDAEGLLDWDNDNHIPGVFVMMDLRPGLEETCLENLPRLTGDHKSQSQMVKKVREQYYSVVVEEGADDQVIQEEEEEEGDESGADVPAQKKRRVEEEDGKDSDETISTVDPAIPEQVDSSNDGEEEEGDSDEAEDVDVDSGDEEGLED